MPGSPWPKKKSPTMAPITDRPAEMRRPAKIAGRAAGNISLRSRVAAVGVLQREQVVHAAVGRLQAEQRVHDDREERDDHAHDHPRRLVP